MKFGTAIFAAVSVSVASTACSDRDAFDRDSRPAAEREDQLAITTRDGHVVLALTKENTVAMRLSDSLRRAVNAEVAREFSKDSADTRFGRWVQRKTANLVEKGMAIEFAVPVDEIRDVTYDDGEIHFEYRGGRKLKFDSFKKDGRSALRDFRPEDAERFVDAVRTAVRNS